MRHTLIVGGGLGGLTTAALLARAGQRVTLLERSAHLGGRGRSAVHDGFVHNVGPHAVYRGGPAARTFAQLGVGFSGAIVAPRTIGRWQGEAVPLPAGAWDIATGPLLRGWERLEALRLLAGLGRVEAGQTTAAWLSGCSPVVGAWARALGRVATYAHPVDALDAALVARQLKLALQGVWYLDGGWQTLVDGVAAAARAAGADLRTGVEVLEADGRSVRTADGRLEADHVVLALPPSSRLGSALAGAVPARQAWLDLELRAPSPAWPGLVLDLDGAGYVSDHGAVARLAPDGSTLVHAAAYLAPDEAADRATVEALVDLGMPGWRERLVSARWFPGMVVQHALPGAGAQAPLQDARGRWQVGDHVASAYLLLDAVVDSAQRVAAEIAAQPVRAAEAAAC